MNKVLFPLSVTLHQVQVVAAGEVVFLDGGMLFLDEPCSYLEQTTEASSNLTFLYLILSLFGVTRIATCFV